MTNVIVTIGEDGYMKIEAAGHAQSVVCAAVSTSLQTSVRFLQELSEQFPEDLQVTIKQQSD
ncbi:ribosomal-processing cysteine protease Prp [Bacillus sp. ISL-35]|uniref:ribosomal-processing cysteine protease Prp n=1 Tax=Bacillus sp. ISL-35 TaxID=2819122 RepID=UPI001BECE743|nr:ribosomal-processing cysteine protease Prp [Bacillus sp. ISL-35]MBT2702978.1 ribosomal-processing cysteine protease Prp [Chryseobacterium sp. ISL-80]